MTVVGALPSAISRGEAVFVRTDFRALAGNAGDYSPMLTQAATARIDLPSTHVGRREDARTVTASTFPSALGRR